MKNFLQIYQKSAVLQVLQGSKAMNLMIMTELFTSSECMLGMCNTLDSVTEEEGKEAEVEDQKEKYKEKEKGQQKGRKEKKRKKKRRGKKRAEELYIYMNV